METYIARQPIFDAQQRAYAYELLFRSGLVNAFDHADINQASSKVIADCCFLLGTENITRGKRAFINVTEDVLLQEYVHLLPRKLTVVELLETIKPTAEVIAACRKLKQVGYLLALDDFVYEEAYRPLIELADIIKVDFLATPKVEQEALVRHFARPNLRFLAEKVESYEVFKEALRMGYHYFQGYFFCRPLIVSKKDVPGFKLNHLRILREIHQPELNYDQIEEIIKRDVSLYYKFLRYINSAAFSWRREIESIKQALFLLGETQFKKWASLITLTSMSQDKPEELVIQAITRARFCELLAPLIGMPARATELFLMGMLSLIDAIMDQPLAEILAEIPLTEDVKGALLTGEGSLHDIYQYILAYERGQWDLATQQAERLKLKESEVPKLYVEAIEWVQESFQSNYLTA